MRTCASGAELGPCAVCGSAGRACARCRVDFYCGKQHQTQDWPRHKLGCGAVGVVSGPNGRCLAVTKDVPAGTVLIRELPLIQFITSWNVPEDAAEVSKVSVCAGAPGLRSPSSQVMSDWPKLLEKC